MRHRFLPLYVPGQERRKIPARLEAPELCFRERLAFKKCGSLSISWSCGFNFAWFKQICKYL